MDTSWIWPTTTALLGVVVGAFAAIVTRPAGASRPTTTPASKADRSVVDLTPWGLMEFTGRPATSLGNQESSSQHSIPGLSPLPGVLTWEDLGHVAQCSGCQAAPAVLRLWSRTLAQAADGLTGSTSASEATSLSVDLPLEFAKSGSNRWWSSHGPERQVLNVFQLNWGWETRCTAWEPLTFEFRRQMANDP